MPKILVVDDEAPIRSLLVEVLEDEGYAVVAAPNGRAAVELATRERPDLVLMDVMMPELDGLAALRRLRALPDLAHVPIILMSAADGAAASEAEAEIATFLPKPFDLDRVVDAVRRALLRGG